MERPILEEGVLIETGEGEMYIEKVWVDEDGNTQVSVKLGEYPKPIGETVGRTLTPEDIYQRLEQQAPDWEATTPTDPRRV